MLYRLLCILCLLILIIIGFFSSTGDVSKPETSKVLVLDSYGKDLKGLSEFRSPKRNLLSLPSKQDTALIAALDGTMYLVEGDSKRVIWSFSTGSPIYSSYQAPLDNDTDKDNVYGPSSGFMECGDDWKLYIQKNPFVKMRLSTSVADFVKATPIILDDGAVTLGSKKNTLFDVDAKTGRLIRSYAISDFDNASSWWSDDRPSAANTFGKQNQGLVETDPAKLNTPELLLKIFRTDYSLQSVSPRSDRVLWSMTVAEFDAVLFCQGNENPSDGASFNLEDEYISDGGLDFAMPYPCRERKEVHRLRKNLLLESPIPERLPVDYHEKEMLPMPDINPMLPLVPNVDDENRMLPSQPTVDGISFGHDESRMVPAPVPNSLPPQQPEVSFYDNYDNAVALPPPPVEINASGKVDGNMMAEWSIAFALILFMLCLLGFVMVRNQSILKGQNESDLKNSPPKKKKIRKSGKNGSSVSKQDKHPSSDDEDLMPRTKSGMEEGLYLNKVDEGADGRRIGKLFVSNKEIAKGSNGTIVLEGIYEGRAVAVKRLVRVHHDIASKEIQNLIASDHHPNIVRWYGVQYDQDFIYLALERCSCSLDDLIQRYSDIFENPVFSKDQTSRCMIKAQMEIGKDNMQGLWKANGFPSPLLLKLMRDMVAGLVHLHELGIIHRDLKPQNVLIIKERSLRVKLSDMGISKRLLGDMSSLGHNATGCGSSGWQAPEQLAQGRQTRAVDLFSLGCVLFFCITGGRHPFGERLERDVNIVRNQKDLFLIEFIPEAEDLISRLLDPNPDQRPKALEVLHHPFFWSSEMRLSFLRDASDRVELEDRDSDSDLLKALEGSAPVALGGKWDEKLESVFVTNIGRYRRYKFDSVRDLLRVLRNKLNHYRELPLGIQELVGPVPDGFNDYFAARFPRLLIEVYKIIFQHCKEEECFQRYFKNID